MKRVDALNKVRIAVEGQRNNSPIKPYWCWSPDDEKRLQEHLTALEALGIVKFEPESMIDCNCSCADTCPQGKVGSHNRCRIPAAKATVTATTGIVVPPTYRA